ncbi:hypothetical protein GCM10020220_013830 [Nonomuraea rubra]|uniref:hypothetical protein n=1 Tax=Nonomuraea rubra TaxID=46180 RepID=UPI0031E9F129
MDDARAEAAIKRRWTGRHPRGHHDAYGPDGHNERLVGRAIKAAGTRWWSRPRIRPGDPGGRAQPVVPGRLRLRELRVNAEPRLVAAGTPSAACAPLDTDVIDLYYGPLPRPRRAIERDAGALAELCATGWSGTSACRT